MKIYAEQYGIVLSLLHLPRSAEVWAAERGKAMVAALEALALRALSRAHIRAY